MGTSDRGSLIVEQQQSENQKTKFQQWYERSKAKLNRKRRARYRKDKAYRKKQLRSTKEWRERTKHIRRKARPPKTHFTIGEVAERIGCYPKTIQNLERAGLLPVMTDGARHRKYTEAQIELIRELVVFRQNTHYKEKGYRAKVRRLVEKIKRKWGH